MNKELRIKAGVVLQSEIASIVSKGNERKLQLKKLAVNGVDGVDLTIDELLIGDVIDRAVNEYSGLFKTLDIKVFESVVMRGLTELTAPVASKGIESIPGVNIDFVETTSGELVQTLSQVGKGMINTFITREAITDTAEGTGGISLWNYLVDSSAKALMLYLTNQLIAGNGAPDNMRGILSSNRVDLTGSLDSDLTRSIDLFQITKSDAAGELGAGDEEAVENIIEFLQSVPTKNRKNSRVFMNPTILSEVERLADTASGKSNLRIKDLVVDGELVTVINSFIVVLDDLMPIKASEAPVMIAGDINAAIEVAFHDLGIVVNPYKKDGAITYQSFPRFSERMKDNTAVRVFVLAA